MNWYILDKDYIHYLMEFDSRVGFVDYDSRLKLHVGVLISVSESDYYVPVSSPRSKHFKMKNSVDFHKIQDFQTGQLYSVINLNNMIPVPMNCATKLKYDNIEKYRSFESQKEKENYIFLLKKEITVIKSDSEILKSKAQNLLHKCELFPNSPLTARCCNFRLLEEKSKLYNPK